MVSAAQYMFPAPQPQACDNGLGKAAKGTTQRTHLLVSVIRNLFNLDLFPSHVCAFKQMLAAEFAGTSKTRCPSYATSHY